MSTDQHDVHHHHDHEPDHGDPHDHGDAHDHPHEHASGLWGRLTHALRPHSHDAADSIDDALTSSERGIRAVKISLVMLGITALVQLVIVYFSGSVSLLADTIHNFSDALTAIPLWIAFVLGRRAATKRYTYGFGRAEDLAGLFVIAMIALSAVLAGWQAIDRLLHPAPMDHVGWVALAGLFGFLGNEAVALFRIREGKAIGSAALVADGYHARTDGFTSLAVLVSAGGVAIGWDWADPAIGLVITAAILMVLRTAAREVFRRLMDGVEPSLLETAETTLAAVPGVSEVRRVRMRWIGHELHADAELDVDPAMPLQEAHELAHRAEDDLRGAVPNLVAATVHAYPIHEPGSHGS
ncbi:cation diffusion facilitator family transporter [Kribbia dieselivorans]|uniref:cation diffusion facilitator family transporter n=1 Tax=Kribbia dieselivorans TaxID=331526 RepID=UPI0008392428|nr:cation diffusion facilitator family transporter [Kribbia dieselivorans]